MNNPSFLNFRNCFFTIILNCNLVLAQSPSSKIEIPSVISPQAYEFTKYGDIPVSKYTGVANIKIPIYNIKAAGLDLPIAISYHSNGLKVAEEASNIGLGWSLIAGGSIVQVVNNLDDYGSYGSPIPAFEHPSFFNIPGGVSDCQSKIINYESDDDGIEPTVLAGFKDSEPDIFKFNFLDYTGSFLYDGSIGQFVSLENKNLKIQSDYQFGVTQNTHPSYFHITVPEGHTFHFALRTTTRIDFVNNSVAGNPSNGSPMELVGQATSRLYELLLIQTNKGEKINFEYEETSVLKNYPSISQTSTWNSFDEFNDSGPLASQYFPQSQTKLNLVITSQKNSYIKKIKTDMATIEFVNLQDRIDLAGAMRLKTILIKDNFNSVVKTFEFTHDYFNGHTNGTTIDNYLPNQNLINKTIEEKSKRLKLLTLKENNFPSFNFIYSNILLPLKTSLAYDLWGYYNNSLSSTLATRTAADELSLSAGLLKKIIYPSKGSSEFTYERNQIDDPNVNPEFVTTNGTLNFFDNNYNNSYVNNGSNFVHLTSSQSGWLLVPEGGATVKLYKSLNVNGVCSSNPSNLTYYPSPSWQIVSYNSSAKNMVETQGWSAIPNFVSNPSYKVQDEIGRINVGENKFKVWSWETKVLKPGVYYFSVGLDNSCGPQNTVGNEAHAFISMEYSITKRIITSQAYGAGLRIKSITNYDENSIKVFERNFKYFLPKLMSKPVFEYNSTFKSVYLFTIGGCSPSGSNCCTILYQPQGVSRNLSTNSYFAPSTNASGKFVGYGRVEEYYINFNNPLLGNGYQSTTFQNQADLVEVNNVNLPLIRNNRENGLVLVDSIFNQNNDLIKVIQNTYEDRQLNCFWGLKSFWKETNVALMLGCSITTIDKYSIGFYPIKRVATYLKSMNEISFSFQSEQNSQTVYDYDSYNQLKEEKKIDSEGNTIEIVYSYPYDRASETVPSLMIEQNQLSSLLNVEKFVNNFLTRSEKMEFIEIKSSNSYIPRKFFDISKVSSKYSALENHEIDRDNQVYADDRLLQFTTKDGITTSLIYGYSGEYIVAEVVGATYAQAISLVNQEILFNPITDSQLQFELDKIRTGIPTALVTTYSYKPLVGITSLKDSNGIIQFFVYDENNRLLLIKDKDGNIMTNYKYNFKN
jgi:hypothetical protein